MSRKLRFVGRIGTDKRYDSIGSVATKNCLKIGVHSKRGKGESSEFANGCKCFKINGCSRCGRVAQLGEHLLCKQGVAGSIPATSTKHMRPAREALLIPRLQSTFYLDNI